MRKKFNYLVTTDKAEKPMARGRIAIVMDSTTNQTNANNWVEERSLLP